MNDDAHAHIDALKRENVALTAERDKMVKERRDERVEFQKLREDVGKQYDACLCPDRNCV